MGREGMLDRFFALSGSAAGAEGVFQSHALGYLFLPGFAAEGLAPLDAAAKRFEFSFALRLVDVLCPLLSERHR